jgi:hypothetical protein
MPVANMNRCIVIGELPGVPETARRRSGTREARLLHSCCGTTLNKGLEVSAVVVVAPGRSNERP